MRSALARLSRACVAVCVAAFVAVSLVPSTAFATHWIVDQNGGGDFTTIQAALDAWQNGLGWRESILVMPGAYPESLAVSDPTFGALVGVGGAESTQVNSLYCQDHAGGLEQLEGLTFMRPIQLDFGGTNVWVKGCAFRGGVFAQIRSPHFEDCDFYGRTSFPALESLSGSIPFRSLRFHGAPLDISLINGDIRMIDCSFEGPTDTLLHVTGSDRDDPISISYCSFKNARYGVVTNSPFGFGMGSCTFRDLSEAAVWLDIDILWSDWGFGDSGIGSSRFENCGTAVHWVPAHAEGQYRYGPTFGLGRDTILACGTDAVVIGPVRGAGISECIIDGSGGNGAFVQLDLPTEHFGYGGQFALVENSVFLNNGGAGLVLQDTPALGHGAHLVRSSTFARNGGPGLRVSCSDWSVEGCVAFANGDEGFTASTPLPSWPARLLSNTSVLNQGDGFRLTGPAYPGDSLHVLQHNLAAMNTGTGFRVPPGPIGSFAYNDAWNNYQSQYVGAWASLDSNLTVDSRFCDLGAGDLGLQQGSPCGAGGIYGLIGALPEQCPNTTAVEPAAPRLAFAVRPTIARGTVEFVPPSFGLEGRIELFDLSGRRLWGAAFGPTTGPLRWQGQSDAGHALPGLYWVRFTRAGEVHSQRLVWLR